MRTDLNMSGGECQGCVATTVLKPAPCYVCVWLHMYAHIQYVPLQSRDLTDLQADF